MESKMNLQFIPAEAADVEIIFSLLKELIDTYEDLSSINYEKVLAWCHSQIEKHINRYTCILADGKKVGWYCFAPSDDGRMELDNFYIHINHLRQFTWSHFLCQIYAIHNLLIR